MGGFRFTQRGNWGKTKHWLEDMLSGREYGMLDQYGQAGVDALASATPVRTGLTADSWSYKIKHGPTYSTIEWFNSHTHEGENIAILIQYGHGTRTGGYVEGIDFINPAIRPIFDQIAAGVWQEVIG